jgi:glycosyltransferase involved in cell wall biosynthesis
LKVLFVGHTYIVRINRDKLYELARFEDIDLTLVTPTVWRDYLFTITSARYPGESITVKPIRIFLNGSEAKYFYYPRIFSVIKEFQPDIIHVEQGYNALSYFQILIGKRLFAPRAKCLFFTWVNWRQKSRFPLSLVERYNLQHSDYAICGNHDAAEILREKGFRKPVTVFPQLGVDTELFKRHDVSELKQGLGLTAGGFVIGFVGRIVKEKGVLLLTQAASRLDSSWRLLFVGTGDAKEDVLKLAAEQGMLDRIRFVDAVSHTEVVPYLNCMDVLVLPSLSIPHWKEQFGHVLIEAMACETPVIGSSSAEIPNVIGDAGLIFKEGDVEDLYEKLKSVMTDAALRNDLASKGKARVLQQYTHSRIAKHIHRIYEELTIH